MTYSTILHLIVSTAADCSTENIRAGHASYCFQSVSHVAGSCCCTHASSRCFFKTFFSHVIAVSCHIPCVILFQTRHTNVWRCFQLLKLVSTPISTPICNKKYWRLVTNNFLHSRHWRGDALTGMMTWVPSFGKYILLPSRLTVSLLLLLSLFQYI